MKLPTLLTRLVLVLGSVLMLGTGCGAADMARSPSREALIPTEAEKDSRLSWWREARFGMFVHWGVYSTLSGTWQGKKYGGYGEHIQRMAKIPIPVYRREVAGSFNPTEFNADEWIRLAEEAGMGYFVITAKHHDGFAMYDSQVSDYNIVKATPFARDPMKELRAACAKYGVKFGFYYSHAFDWGEENGPGNDWDYQNPGGDKLLNGSEWWLKDKDFLPKARKYVDEKSIPQLQELIRNYDPDIIWFDTPHKLPPEENLRILAAVRKAKPSMVINGRLVRGCGDYASTADRPAEFQTQSGDWEGVPTTNESYGYNENDHSHKPVAHFIQLLAKSAARGGNELMNIGPMGNGRIDQADVNILQGIFRWWKMNGQSIRGTVRTPLAVQAWGESTRKGNTLYLHVFDWPRDGKLVVGGLKTDVVKARLLAGDEAALSVSRTGNDVTVTVPATAPDAADSVVVLECAGEPLGEPRRLLVQNIATNLLRSFDGQLKGGLRFGAGKSSDAWANEWKKTSDEVVWPSRLSRAGTFEVRLVYDAPMGTRQNRVQEGDAGKEMVRAHSGAGGVFEVRIGETTLTGKVVIGTNVKADLGRVTLVPGSFEIRVLAKEITGEELFRLRAIELKPVADGN